MDIASQLFEYEGWDDIGDSDSQFYDCVLKVPLCGFPAGSKVEIVVLILSESKLQIMDQYAEEGEYKINESCKLKLTAE